MHRPLRVTAPAALPVSIDDVKKSLRIDSDDDDDTIESLIQAAVDHYEGWTGILGICLVEQTWRQSFDRFGRALCLPLGPVIEAASVSWQNAAGQISTIPAASYGLETSAGGQSEIRFRNAFSLPSTQILRQAGDAFFTDADTSSEWEFFWGSEKGKVATQPKRKKFLGIF